MTSSKLLVCVLSYNAENFIRDTLERIPPSLGQFDTHVLVIDDASTDRGYEIACEIRDAGFIFPLTVLKNSTNQGYGGNAKLGILYAINEGFDAVALTHGDGQYRLVIEARPRSVLSEILAQATKDAKHNSSRTDKVST